MADANGGFNIPKRSVIYGLLCVAVVLIFVLWGIIPASRSLAELDTKISDSRYRLEERKALAPLFKTLQGQSERSESQVLPLPEQGKLPQARLGTIPSTFKRAATVSGMTLVSAVLSLDWLTGDVRLMSVNVVLRGEFAQFRKFLIQLGGLPYVQRIEEIFIQGTPDAKEFRLKVWVAIG